MMDFEKFCEFISLLKKYRLKINGFKKPYENQLICLEVQKEDLILDRYDSSIYENKKYLVLEESTSFEDLITDHRNTTNSIHISFDVLTNKDYEDIEIILKGVDLPDNYKDGTFDWHINSL